MDEFRSLNWSWRAYASDVDLEKSYHLDMGENARANLADVFHSNLLQIDPSHLLDYCQQQKARTAKQELNESSVDTVQHKFTDPRTQIMIPTFTCDHRDTDLAARNILLVKCIEMSKLSADEHCACLRAILKLKSRETTLPTDDEADRATYFATIQQRFDEKSRFLAFLKRHYFETLSHRYHSVHPAVDLFIAQKWKRHLLDLYTITADDAYRLSTALKVNRQMDDDVNAELVHQEHHGNVPKMLSDVSIVRQSNENLLRAYQRHRSDRFRNAIRKKSIEIADGKQVNAVVPISVIKLLISDYDVDWSIRMTVRDAVSSSVLSPIKEVAFAKPLPPLYLSGNDRKTRGNKYVLRTTVCPQHSGAFCHSTKTISDPLTNSDRVIDCQATNEVKYELHSFDEAVAKCSELDDQMSAGNCSFRIWDLSSGSETIRLMVPAKTDAFRKCENGVDVEMVNLSSKLEFQAEYGVEVMTKAELLREWCHQYFRPESITVRFRSDAESGQIIKTETIKLDEIEANLRNLYGVERKTLLKYLWTSIQTFLNFPIGEFLLRHSSMDSGMIKVYQKCDRTDKSITIQSIYEKIAFEKSQFDKIEWQPIDDQSVTGIHRTTNILPCAFPPASYYESNGIALAAAESKAKPKSKKTQKGEMSADERQIKPKDDSGWVAKRSENRKATQARPEQLRKSIKNATKRQKKRKNLLIKREQKNVELIEAKELASLKKISVDEYKAVDKAIEPTPCIMRTCEPRLTRKRASQHFTTRKTNPIDIARVQHEISKRRALGFATSTASAAKPVSDTDSNSTIITRSGRVVRTRQK